MCYVCVRLRTVYTVLSQYFILFLFIVGFCQTSICAVANDRIVVKPNLDYSLPMDTIKVDSSPIVFYSKFNTSCFDMSYRPNAKSLGQLDVFFTDASLCSTIDTLKIIVSASPDGKHDYNIELAQARALSLKRLLITRYPFLKGVVIETDSYIADWSKLKELIQYDFDLPYRSTVIDVLNLDRDAGAIGWKLKKIGDNKEAWRYLTRNYMHYLRAGDVSIQTIYKEKKSEIKSLDDLYRRYRVVDTLYVDTLYVRDALQAGVKIHADTMSTLSSAKITAFDTEQGQEREDFLALKTNLLFDALTLVNVEIELPIGNRWSIAGEWMFPWWIGKNNDKALQILSGTVEGRYWFGDRLTKPKLTGWFAGVYVGGGIYDLQKDSKGYQGDFFILTGISGGFAHTINKSQTLRMEYSLGVGYLKTDYQYYKGEEANKYLVWQNDGEYTWVGPTKAKISLVWMLGKKGGGER